MEQLKIWAALRCRKDNLSIKKTHFNKKVSNCQKLETFFYENKLWWRNLVSAPSPLERVGVRI